MIKFLISLIDKFRDWILGIVYPSASPSLSSERPESNKEETCK
jgi:hypothetical protein